LLPETIASNRFKLIFEEVTLNTESFLSAQIRVCPTPTINTLHIELPASIALHSIRLYNILGQEVLTCKERTIPVNGLADRVYS
jgi:hypothetical protein